MKLVYCNKRKGSASTCSNVACYKGIMRTNSRNWNVYRCEECKNQKTRRQLEIELEPFDQSSLLEEVTKYLSSLVGLQLQSSNYVVTSFAQGSQSSFHKNKSSYIGRFTKDNGSIMCQDQFNQWKCLYYHQLKNLSNQGVTNEQSVY